MIAKMIENTLDDLNEKVTWKEIAEKLNLTPSAISHFRNKGTELSFSSLHIIAKLLYPKKYVDVLANWCNHLTKPQNIKFALEFLANNRKLVDLESLIKQINSSKTSSKLLQELAQIYTLLLTHLRRDIKDGFIHEIKGCNFKTPEANFLKCMCKVYYYNVMSDIKSLTFHNSNAYIIAEEIKDESLREFYLIRAQEMESVSLLFYFNKQVESRSISENIIEKVDLLGDTYLAESYYRIGMSYLFTSPDMCLTFLKRSIKTFSANNRKDRAEQIEKNEYELASVLWDRVSSVETLTNNTSKAFYLSKNGDKEESLRIAKELNEDSPFTKYYVGIAKEDYNILLESLVIFSQRGNLFYANLPYTLLKDFAPLKNVANLLIKPN